MKKKMIRSLPIIWIALFWVLSHEPLQYTCLARSGEPKVCLAWATKSKSNSQLAVESNFQLATGYNAWVAIHNISASRRWRWQRGRRQAGANKSSSHVQGRCYGLNIALANIYRGQQLGAGVPQTTRVRKAINKQDTRRMSNINNKNESCWRSHLLHKAPAPSV